MTDRIVRALADTPGRFTWGNATEFIRKGYEAELGFMTPIDLSGYFGINYNRHVNDTASKEFGEEVILEWIPTRSYKSGLKFKNRKLDLMINLRGRWI